MTVSVLTFNYDLALDFGFPKRVAINYALVDGDDDGSLALELHGSLNWVS